VASPKGARTKLGVDIDPKLKRRLNMEAADSGLKLKELIDLRLRDSIRQSPRIRKLAASVAPTP
jgi:predicted HicB family RNase H-like nuclease